MKLRAIAKRLASRLLPAAVIGFFVAGGVMTATATGPVFNALPNDYPTLQVAQPGTQYGTQVQAMVGDQLYMVVTAHNSVKDTTAVNTRAKIDLGTGIASTHTPTGTVSASNAASVSSQVSIATGANTGLSYVPESAELLKNVNGAMTVVNWPAGVNKNDVVSANGVSLGSIDGCWDFMQQVRIRVVVTGTTPGLNINKKVGIAGGAVFGDSVTGAPNDGAEYRIFVENTGQGIAKSPKVTDVLDARHTYIAGTSIARFKVNGNDVDQNIPDSSIVINTLSDGRQSLTYSFPDMANDPTAAFYLQFQVRLGGNDKFPVGSSIINNTAAVCVNGGLANAFCKDTNQTTITVVRNADQVVTFTLIKQISNVTLGDTTWKDEQLGAATPGDTVAFRLIVTNTGNTTAQTVVLKDMLPAGMSYLPGTTYLYNKNTTAAGIKLDDSIVANGYTFNAIEANTQNQQVVIFKAKISDQCSGSNTMTNRAQVLYQGAVKAEDTAGAIVSCTKGLFIQKDIKNAAGQFVDDAGVVSEGTVLTYRIYVQNTGNTTVMNPVVRDILPADVTYVQNSMSIDSEFTSSVIQNAFFNQGVTLTNLTPGMGKVIVFQVKVENCPQYGDTKLVNTATVRADGIADKSDTATVTVRVNRPTQSY